MTTIETSSDVVAAGAADGSTGEGAVPGLGGPLAVIVDWLTSADHKVIGRLFVAGGVLGLLGTIVVNIVLAIERTDGDSIVTDGGAIPQLIDAQRIGFVFGAALPLATGLCLAVVPLQLGARALAFARLAMLGFWLWFGGLVVSTVALARDGGTLGGDPDMVELFIGSMALMALGALAAAVPIATSVLTTRAPGMTMRRVPFFSWSALVYALCLVLVMPVLCGTLVYLFVDHRYSRIGFGGNEGIYDWAGWVLTQPTTFIFAIPVFGLLAGLFPLVFGARTPARGVMFGGLSLIGVAALAGVTQLGSIDLPWAGSGLSIGDGDDFEEKLRDVLPWAFFNLLPILGALIVFAVGLAVLRPRKGARPNATAAMLFAFVGADLVLLAMLASVLRSIDDLDLQGTVFEEGVVAALAYGIAIGVMGGILHWSPKLTGRLIPAGKAAPLALLGGAGALLVSVPYFIAGFLDQPDLFSGGWLYEDSDLVVWNVVVLVGHCLMALTALGFVMLVLQTKRVDADDEDAVDDDPWGGQTVEWLTTSPAPAGNFAEVPVVTSTEPMLDLAPVGAAAGEGDR
jgi:heme/copper-type cytochrome/quinol oxidase subunit 1